MSFPKILLASRSPRRKQLLSQIVGGFDIQAPEADEDVICATPEETVIAVASRKLDAVVNSEAYDIIIACDTLVYLDGIYYGKPADEEDAKKMLRALSGKTHKVVSGFIVRGRMGEIARSVVSYVTFRELSDEDIAEYVQTEKPLDKAGSYAVQDGRLVASYAGDYTNIMGLPLEDVRKATEEIIGKVKGDR